VLAQDGFCGLEALLDAVVPAARAPTPRAETQRPEPARTAAACRRNGVDPREELLDHLEPVERERGLEPFGECDLHVDGDPGSRSSTVNASSTATSASS